MAITRDEAKHLARLSQLTLTDAELDHLTPQLDEIIRAVARVQEVATDGIPPTLAEIPFMDPFHDKIEKAVETGRTCPPVSEDQNHKLYVRIPEER